LEADSKAAGLVKFAFAMSLMQVVRPKGRPTLLGSLTEKDSA